MNLFEMIIVGAAALAIAYVAIRIGGWLLDWAFEAVQAAIPGVVRGLVQLVDDGGIITAYALGKIPHRGRLQVVEEIEVDEDDLDEEVLEALREHGAVRESFYV